MLSINYLSVPLSILRLFLSSLFFMLLHMSCRNPWVYFCLLRGKEAATLLHFFPASRHHNSYLPWWQRMTPQTPDIRREQGRNNYQSLYSHVTTHSKGLRPSSLTNFSTYIEWWCQSRTDISSLSSSQRWDVCPSLFQTTSISGVMLLGSPSLFGFCWKTVPLFFLTTLFKEKGHSPSQKFFFFFFTESS